MKPLIIMGTLVLASYAGELFSVLEHYTKSALPRLMPNVHALCAKP